MMVLAIKGAAIGLGNKGLAAFSDAALTGAKYAALGITADEALGAPATVAAIASAGVSTAEAVGQPAVAAALDAAQVSGVQASDYELRADGVDPALVDDDDAVGTCIGRRAHGRLQICNRRIVRVKNIGFPRVLTGCYMYL